jgi:hypothetical protein
MNWCQLCNSNEEVTLIDEEFVAVLQKICEVEENFQYKSKFYSVNSFKDQS